MSSPKYTIKVKHSAKKGINKICKNNEILGKMFRICFKKLSEDPFSFSLRTHLVNLPYIGKVYSSRVSGDLRVLWVFDESESIVIYDVGGHSGGRKVYR